MATCDGAPHGDPEEAFGLAALVDSATDDLTIELSFEAICIGFGAFAREGELYRTLAGAPMPCLQTCMGAIQLDGVTEMRTAQSTDEAVEARVGSLLQARGLLPASAGQKRLADGSANDTAATTAAIRARIEPLRTGRSAHGSESALNNSCEECGQCSIIFLDVYHTMPHCLPPHLPLSTTPCPAAYHPAQCREEFRHLLPGILTR